MREIKLIIAKINLAVFLALVLNLSLNNVSFALEGAVLKNRYPDYAFEFVGKDKFESFNRKIFNFNTKMNQYVLKPVNIVWASVMPKYGMDRIQSACKNMEYPIRVVSCLLQKDFKSSKSETLRFLTNTTIGFAGFYDPALTKFKIEPRDEDMAQALAHFKLKSGPYLVLPIVAQGSIREIAGKALDVPLNPTSYVVGPVAAIAKAALMLNQTTTMQPVAKMICSTYADPYEIAKKLGGVEHYIKNENLDRAEIFTQKTSTQNIIKINQISYKCDLKPDVNLNNYNPQCPLIDAMRTVMFNDPSINDSMWSELSVWNKCFSKQIKVASISVDKSRPNYKYRYILQKNKTSPLAIIYPSIGEDIRSHSSDVLAKMLYDEGYSVLIEGSPFQWEFVKSMPKGYRPGFPANDAKYLRMVTAKMLADLETRKECKFSKKILIGTSFGAMTALFTAAQEDKDNTLGISKYISVNPPIELLFALKQLDKYSDDWKNDSSDLKMRVAVTAEKVLKVYQQLSDKKAFSNKNSSEQQPAMMPFTEDEAKLITGFVMRQKLSDLVYTIENDSNKNSLRTVSDSVSAPQAKQKPRDVYSMINNLSFDDYAQKYLQVNQYKSEESLSYDTSLYSIADYLQKSDNYKIYHALDDYYVNPVQLSWLKNESKDKVVLFNNGSHLGFMYRKEFRDDLREDVCLKRPQVLTQANAQ